jgi:hypothetical protein
MLGLRDMGFTADLPKVVTSIRGNDSFVFTGTEVLSWTS